jgi:hypothetical protein
MTAMRVRTVLAISIAVLASLAATPHAAGQEPDEPEGVTIGDGIYIRGATITPLDGGPTRTLDDYQAAVFAQSFIGQALFGPEDAKREPPAGTPVYRVDIEGWWAQDDGIVTVHYADDGTTPFVAFPGFVVTPELPDPPPEPTGWFAAPERTRDAFNGEGELVETTGINQATATTAAPGAEPAPAGSGDDGGAPTWLWGALAAVVLVGLGLWFRSRRSEDEPAEDALV